MSFDPFHVRITYMDGGEEFVRDVTHAVIRDGVLALSCEWYGQLGHQREERGQFPIHNIRHWKREER